MDIDGNPVVHQHAHWTVVRPSVSRDDSVIHSFRSLIYVNKTTQFRPISISSPNIVAGLLKTAIQPILVASVYVSRDPSASASKEDNARELGNGLYLITSAWREAKATLIGYLTHSLAMPKPSSCPVEVAITTAFKGLPCLKSKLSISSPLALPSSPSQTTDRTGIGRIVRLGGFF